MDNVEKKKLIKKYSPPTTVIKNCFLAFIFGGAICVGGELLLMLYTSLGMSSGDAGTVVTATLIAVAAGLTALGLFDSIARYAGAGTLVPVTGFSNAVTSSAMDAKSEGIILGVGAKIFTVAGPVILFGLIAGVLYGVIYYAAGIIGGLL